jgi:plastocyanin
MRIVAALIWLGCVTLAASCGGQDAYRADVPAGPTRTPRPDATAASPEDGTQPATTTASGESTRAAPPAATAAGAHEILLFDFKIEPFLLDLGQGGPLTVRSMGALTHTFAIYRDASFSERLLDAGEIAPGESTTLAVSLAPGTYYARCEIHPLQMRAAITIE